MREERLTERLRSWEKEPQRRAREDPGRAIDSILRHLQRILNTRQGNVPIADDYGLPDFTEFLSAYPRSLKDFERSIRHTILKYEPRLKAVRVSFIPREDEPLALRFQIVGQLATEKDGNPVYFESVVGSEGKITIRR